MKSDWINTDGDENAAKHSVDFWAIVKGDLDAGQFWADRIKQYRDEPVQRLQIALENLPLPAAFREAVTAVRAIIRSKRKSGEAFEEQLGLLYWLAAIQSFMLPYADRLREPGFNVVAAIPGKRLKSLPMDYSKLGYNRLSLLNKTDKRWIVEAWGEPTAHTTLNELHRGLWDEYENKLVSERQEQREAFLKDLSRLK